VALKEERRFERFNRFAPVQIAAPEEAGDRRRCGEDIIGFDEQTFL
jgi:hypothetical protein